VAVLGLGTDIVEISRVQKAVSERFAKRVLTDTELEIFREHHEPARYLAKRWSAKEAAAKALGTGIGRGISFQHFEILNDELGAPILTLTGQAKVVADEKGITTWLVSISDEQNYAMATVVLS